MSQMRMSIMQPTPNAKSRTKREEEDYNFMTLPDSELVGCMCDIGFVFTLSDLQKPQPQQIQRIFESFVELTMNANRAIVAPAMGAAADDICGEYSDIFTSDTRDMMGFFVLLRKMLQECGVNDFTLNDLYRPTRERLVKIFSSVINYLRFRESQASIADEHYNKTEKTKARIEALSAENAAKEDQRNDLDRNRRNVEALIAEKEKRYNALKDRLLVLKDVQGRVVERLDRIREDQARLKTAIEEGMAAKVTAQQESEKLRPYTEQSPIALENSLRELNTALSTDKASIDTLDRRARALQSSSDAFTTVTADVEACTALLHDLQRDLASVEAASTAASKSNDALAERSNAVRDMERREKQLQKQLDSTLAKTEKQRCRAKERSDADAKRMEELKKVSDELRRERGESGREMERKRARIEQIEKKMADLKEAIEREVQSAQAEYAKMEGHILGYMREMGGALVV